MNQVFTFTLNDFLGTNHVFYLCTFCISIKTEMETAHLAVKEVGMEVQNWVGSVWFRKGRWGLRKSLASPSDPVLILFTCEWVRGQLSDHLPGLVVQSLAILGTCRIPPGCRMLYPMTRASSVPKMEWTAVDNSMGFRVQQGLNPSSISHCQL